MPIAGTNLTLDSREGYDRITQVEKVTTPYFSDGTTTLTGATLTTSSLTATNQKYFFGISNTSTLTTEEFNVAFGSVNGYGASVETGTKSETAAIYGQYASLLLGPTEVTGGFFISSPASNSAVASGKDEEIYVLSSRRTNTKDRINKGTWTVRLSGSSATGVDAALVLCDDSVDGTPTATGAGPRYNIVSGSAGTLFNSTVSSSAAKNYGFFYPDAGLLVFSAAELSSSIPGVATEVGNAVGFNTSSGLMNGLGYAKTTNLDSNQALRLANCLQQNNANTALSFRDEEDQISSQYFCRVRSLDCNFSNNPTFVSGSNNELRQSTMKDNPNTFITSVQLYNDAGDMVAVGNLSTPLKKNFSSEATIKVKLTY